MADVVLGIDGGATKTDVAVATLDGQVVGRAIVGGSNWEVVGLEAMAATLRSGCDEALASAGLIPSYVRASAFCLAGCDWDRDHSRIDSHLAELGLSGHRVLVTDARAALRAGTDETFGIASIAGTGGSTCGRNRAGVWFRTLAVSIGEGAGASEVVRRALEAVAREHHGQVAASGLTPAILSAVGVDSIAELFERLSRGPRPAVGPELAPTVFEVAAGGDDLACEVVTSVGVQHARDVIGVANRLYMRDDTFAVVRAGGLHRAANRVFDVAFEGEVRAALPGANLDSIVEEPVRGAIRLAVDTLDR